MDETINLDLSRLSNRDKSLLVGAMYRQSLVQVGKSPDYHLKNLTDDFLVCLSSAAGAFLRKVKAFFFSLDPLEGEIFVNECLEHGRHYRFWYLSFYKDADYKKDLLGIYSRVATAF